MLVSVIIPSYKPGDYLWECLDSLYNQTLQKDLYEVIIILNGCNEPYNVNINKYISEHSKMNICLYHTDIPGVSNARNIGIDVSNGEYITFIDDDDLVSSNYLSELLRVSSSSCVGCSNSYCFVDSTIEKKDNFITNGYKKCSGKRFSLFHYRCFLSAPWAKLIHKKMIGDNRFPLDLKKSEDSVFCLRISSNINDMKLASADTIYYQRLRTGSAMRTRQPVGKILKDHLYIEWKYIREWFRYPFRYNVLFVLSRIIACGKNCYSYIKNNS